MTALTIHVPGVTAEAEKDFEASLTQTATYIKPMEVMEFVPKIG